MTRRTKSVIVTTVGATMTVVIAGAFSMRGTDRNMLVLMAFMVAVAASAVGASVWILGKVITPVEQAYRIGYQTGYDDGRRADKPLVIDCTTELRRRARGRLGA